MVAVISDIHAHALDLQAVLKHIQDKGCDEIWCLGDFASGAGDDPALCFDLVVENCSLILGGNHELMVAGRLFDNSQGSWADWARRAHSELGPKRINYLMGLPSVVDGPYLQLAHASLRDPLWEFVSNPQAAQAQFGLMERDYLLIGHTHKAALWGKQGPVVIEEGKSIDLPRRAILNPGAVERQRRWLSLEMEQDRPTRALWHSA